MNDIQEALNFFWEVLTGVIDDDQAKLIRLLCFVLLLLGILWAGLNYFLAERTKFDGETYDPAIPNAGTENKALEEIIEVAKTVGTMRKGGEALAQSLSGMNKRLFTLDGYNEFGLEDLSGQMTGSPESLPVNTAGESTESTTNDNDDAQPDVLVKGVILSGKSSLAVVEMGGEKGLIVRTGTKLPGDAGRVVRIRKDGITIRRNGKEVICPFK